MKKLMAICFLLVLLLAAFPVSIIHAAVWEGFNIWIGEGSTHTQQVTLSDWADLEIDWYDLAPGDGDALTVLVDNHEISGPTVAGDIVYVSLPPGLYDIGFRCDEGGGNDVIPINYTITEMAFTGNYFPPDLFQIVAVDIKPGSCPNPLNVESRGILPIAILGTEDFDVTTVDPESVRLEGVEPLRWDLKDVATPYEPFVGKEAADSCTVEGPDGYMDLSLKFDTQAVIAALGEVSDGQVLVLMLTGNLMAGQGGTLIVGEDVVVIISQEISGNMVLPLGDDDYEEVPLGFAFPYQGQDWTSVFVNSNGNLTFGAGDTDFSTSIAEFLNGQPRIAPLWADLNPASGGEVAVSYAKNGKSMTIRFIEVPEFAVGGANTFSVELKHNGSIAIMYGTVTADFPEPFCTYGLVGITEGGGAADPGETDLSMAKGLLVSGTIYEQFTGGSDSFDMEDTILKFHPEE